MTLEERLAMLETRLCALEDEREIANLIVQYGIALDSGAAAAAAAVFAEEALYDTDVVTMRGPAEVAAMVNGARDQSMVGRCGALDASNQRR